MKLLKKVGATLVSCAMLAATAIPAAADEAYMKLLTVPVSKMTGYNGYLYNGISIFSNGSEFWRIDTQQWQESGEISYSAVSLDDELQGMENLGTFSDTGFTSEDDYALFRTLDENGKTSQRFVVKYDKESNSLETVSKYDYWCYATDDGYVIVDGMNDEGKAVIQITAPDGTENACEFSLCEVEGSYPVVKALSRSSDKYVYYIMFPTSVTPNEEISLSTGSAVSDWTVELYGVDRAGKAVKLYSDTVNGWGIDTTVENGCLFGTQKYIHTTGEIYQITSLLFTKHIYCEDTDELHSFVCGETNMNGMLYVYDGDGYGGQPMTSLESKIYGTKAIAYAEYGGTDGAFGTYALIDVQTGEKIGDHDYMKYMSTEDGKMYIVQTADDKWGFMNSKGKVLRTYDDAGPFIGDYAPVVKDGKAFLIDRSMKRVSEKIDADSVSTFEENLFRIKKGDEYYFMTFSNETAGTAAEEPTEPTEEPTITEEPAETDAPAAIAPEKPETEAPEAPVEQAPAESAPTASPAANKGNPDTGAAVAVMPLLIAGAGAAALSRKRK